MQSVADLLAAPRCGRRTRCLHAAEQSLRDEPVAVNHAAIENGAVLVYVGKELTVLGGKTHPNLFLFVEHEGLVWTGKNIFLALLNRVELVYSNPLETFQREELEKLPGAIDLENVNVAVLVRGEDNLVMITGAECISIRDRF